jgi:hypothetical protein
MDEPKLPTKLLEKIFIWRLIAVNLTSSNGVGKLGAGQFRPLVFDQVYPWRQVFFL